MTQERPADLNKHKHTCRLKVEREINAVSKVWSAVTGVFSSVFTLSSLSEHFTVPDLSYFVY